MKSWSCLQERDLCANHRFLPSFYLSLKAAFLREAAQRPQRAIPRTDARNMFRLEPAKSLRVYELLQRAGWLPAAPQRTRGTATAPHSEAPSPSGAPALGSAPPNEPQNMECDGQKQETHAQGNAEVLRTEVIGGD